MDGVLIIDKPAGMTSHDVVDRVREALGTRRVGHGGTLDPEATGVLVIGVGKATRFLSYAQDAPKRYAACIRFGTTTTTQDASGEVVERRPAQLNQGDVERVLEEFIGTFEQTPPMVSAVKVGGERLYHKARRGEEIDRPSRRVTVYSLKLRAFRPGEEPEADLDLECSAGTYVRTIADDLGERVGCGAHLAALRRERAGGATLADAIALEDVDPGCLRPTATCVAHLEALVLDAQQAQLVAHGRPIEGRGGSEGSKVALLRDGDLAAVYRREGSRLVAERVMPE